MRRQARKRKTQRADTRKNPAQWVRHALGSRVCDALQLLALCRPMTDVCWQLLATRLSKESHLETALSKYIRNHQIIIQLLYGTCPNSMQCPLHRRITSTPFCHSRSNCVDLRPFPRCAMLSSSLQGRMQLIRANASHWQRLGSRLSCPAYSTDVAVTDAFTRAWIQQLPTASGQAFPLFFCNCQFYVTILFYFNLFF